MLLIFVATIWGIQMRRRYGRFCGGLLIVTFLCWFMYQLLFVNGKSLNDAEVIGEFTGKMLFVCGAGYWLYAFCFSPAAQRYFSSGDELL